MSRTRGEVALALLRTAAERPCTAVELAERACVGYARAKDTVSRMLERGELVRLSEKRPAGLGTPTAR